MKFETTGKIRHHAKEDCHSPPLACPFHAPSDHPMVDWPMWLRETGLIERTCPHGVGHPDPDSAAYMDTQFPGGASGAHGCDGCCRDGRARVRFPGGTNEITFNPNEGTPC